MAVSVTHATSATLPDDPSAEIGSNEWNAEHTIVSPYVAAVIASAPVAYWRLAETSGSTAADEMGNVSGTYTGTLTQGVSGAIDDDDGAGVRFTYPAGSPQGYVRIGGSALNGVISGDLGSMMAWGRIINPGFYSQTSDSGYLVHLRNGGATTYYMVMGHIGTNGARTLSWRHRSGTPLLEVTEFPGVLNDYFCMAMTWTDSGNAMKAYLNGVQVGTTQTGMDAFNDDFTSTTDNCIGAGSSTAQPWGGDVADVALWDRVLTATEISDLYALGRRTFDDWVGSIDPRLLNSSAAMTADEAYMGAFSVKHRTVVTSAVCQVVTASGNFDMGIYDAAGTRLGSTGTTAMPAAGMAKIDLTAPVTLYPGRRYWGAIASHTGSGAVMYYSPGVNNIIYADRSRGTSVSSSFVLPATISISETTTLGRLYGVYFE